MPGRDFVHNLWKKWITIDCFTLFLNVIFCVKNIKYFILFEYYIEKKNQFSLLFC